MNFLAKFDLVLQHLVEVTMKGDILDHYCGKRIQRELIDVLFAEVGSIFISQVLLVIYYTVTANCNPAVSQQKQLSLTIQLS